MQAQGLVGTPHKGEGDRVTAEGDRDKAVGYIKASTGGGCGVDVAMLCEH
jgi:hypothetical protein